MRNLKELIGFELISMNESGFKVKKENKEYYFEFSTYQGDCCGYSWIDANLLINDEEKPIITNVEYVCDIEEWESNDLDSVKITFFGTYKPIAEITSKSGSGTSWQYGASAAIICKQLDFEETITSW